MITGASQAEAAVLIIDVNEGVKEQTKRHAYILSLLGLKQVIVVLNKMDLVGFGEPRFLEVRGEIEKFLRSINIHPIYYIPIAAMTGENIARKTENMTWYGGPTFLESLDSLTNREAAIEKPLIFPIQDIYKVDDKRIAAGRIEAGVLRTGQEVRVLPTRQMSKVKSVEKFPKQVGQASSGESIGITVENSLFLDRGYVLCEPGKEPILTDTFRASVFWMAKRVFSKTERLIFRCSTQETTGKIETIRRRINSSSLEIIEEEANELGNLEVGEVIIKTKNPIVIKTFQDVQELGRFVMVRDEDICAGGIITAIE
jgi:sulfate adenylyltransferase subunit 1 (EFTu-like GTPase family)